MKTPEEIKKLAENKYPIDNDMYLDLYSEHNAFINGYTLAQNDMREELIKYAKWYDRATMPEDAQTPEEDLIQNVDSYIKTNLLTN